jgi:pimeloyl-ACP methyl ester carboxylesterase
MKILAYDRRQNNEPKAKTVFLHGFPSLRSKQNRELADRVTEELQSHADLLLYSGLGFAEGTFTFSGCVHEVNQYFERTLPSGSVDINLVGHSWGGFLSLLMASRFGARVRKMILLSPLLFFGNEEQAMAGLKSIVDDNPQLALGEARALVRDFCSIGLQNPTEKLIQQIPTGVEILFLQAKVDQLTPPEIAKSFAAKMQQHFKTPPEFELVDNDHSFLNNRPELSLRMAQFLAR